MSSNKYNSYSSKTSSYGFSNSRLSSANTAKSKTKVIANPRKVLPSQKVPQNSTGDKKSSSTGGINERKTFTKPKKTTKSDFNVGKQGESSIDFCKKCGDVASTKTSTNTSSSTSRSTASKAITKSITNVKKPKPKPLQQFYKNENYRQSTESMPDITNATKKISLDTIKEVSELRTSESVFKIYPDFDEDITFIDTDDQECLKQLKEFRLKNYFECHSAKSRVKHRGSATSLQDHRCVYRFYLNERLFPVPLSTDHNNQVRCVECHLPMDLNVEDSTKINGTIQAKVTLRRNTQDLMLLLPVKEPLIITEKRKQEKKNNRDVVYFGVINLDGFGHSMFNSTLPNNSFALKYQKGFKKFQDDDEYSYRTFDKNDVIVI